VINSLLLWFLAGDKYSSHSIRGIEWYQHFMRMVLNGIEWYQHFMRMVFNGIEWYQHFMRMVLNGISAWY